MVDPVAFQHAAATSSTCGTDYLSLTCENCEGKNNNPWVLCYVFFLGIKCFQSVQVGFLYRGKQTIGAMGMWPSQKTFKSQYIACPANIFCNCWLLKKSEKSNRLMCYGVIGKHFLKLTSPCCQLWRWILFKFSDPLKWNRAFCFS